MQASCPRSTGRCLEEMCSVVMAQMKTVCPLLVPCNALLKENNPASDHACMRISVMVMSSPSWRDPYVGVCKDPFDNLLVSCCPLLLDGWVPMILP